MFAKTFFGGFPNQREAHPTWKIALPSMPSRIVSCMDDDTSEPNLQSPVQKYDLVFSRMKTKALLEPADESLPGSQYLAKIVIDSRDQLIDPIDPPAHPVYITDYPIIFSFLAQKYNIKGIEDFKTRDITVPMQQCMFVFYKHHHAWSQIVKVQIDLLAQMMMGTEYMNRPDRPAGTSHRDVGFMLYFERQKYICASTNSPPTLAEYNNTILHSHHLLGEEAQMLRDNQVEILNKFQFELLRYSGMLSTTDFSIAKVEKQKPAKAKKKAKKEQEEETEEKGTNDEPEACDICMDASDAADVQCCNAKCSKSYHSQCLRRFMQQGSTSVQYQRIDLNNTLVKCLFCTSWMVVHNPV